MPQLNRMPVCLLSRSQRISMISFIACIPVLCLYRDIASKKHLYPSVKRSFANLTYTYVITFYHIFYNVRMPVEKRFGFPLPNGFIR